MDFSNNEGFPTYEEILKMKESGVKDVWVVLSERTGIHKEKLRAKFNREKAQRNAYESLLDVEETTEEVVEPVSKIEEKYSYNDNGDVSAVTSQRVIALSEEEKKSPDYVLEAHGFDPKLWVITNANNFWGSPRPKDAGTRTLYQSKISIKPKVEKTNLSLDDIKFFFDNIEEKILLPEFVASDYSRNKSGKTVLINLADAHFGNEDSTYSTKEKVENLVTEIIDRCSQIHVKEIIFVNFGDLIHVDNEAGQTTGLTQVGERGTVYQIWETALVTLIQSLTKLSKIAPVEYIGISGNHDRVNSFTVNKALEYALSNNEDITFDVDFSHRKYRTVGSSLFGFAHGDLPQKNVATLLQREARKEYGESTYAYMLLGHIHHISIKDNDGVIVSSLPSITSTDYWHNAQGYTGNWRGTYVYVVDEGYGIQDTWHIQA